MTPDLWFWLVILGALVVMVIDLALGVRSAEQVRRGGEVKKSSSMMETLW